MTLWSEITLRLTPILLGIVLMAWQVTPAQADDNNRMSIEQAQRLVFPEATQFIATPIKLSDAQKESISEVSALKVRFNDLPVWQALDAQGTTKGMFIVDKVIGKHEFITYAIGITSDAKTTPPFILDYRESYGQQVEHDEWRHQFVGKARHDTLKVGKDIDNISGATLSCVNITNGIRRLLVSYDIAIAPMLVKN